MTIRFQSHGGSEKPIRSRSRQTRAALPAQNDIAVDERADFGYLLPPSSQTDDYLPESDATIADLDALGNAMVNTDVDPESLDASTDSSLPPVLTYWGQFLDHELTARTDRDSEITSIMDPTPTLTADNIETALKNARSPAFDLDSVYGGTPIGPDLSVEVATVISGLRHPILTAKMRVGTAQDIPSQPDGSDTLPDNLDPHRDLPRYGQVEENVTAAAAKLAGTGMSADELQQFKDSQESRALIGDMRNDENLAIAQFHVSFLRFHNKAVDYLENNETGWIADFDSAKRLTRLHYQWLAVEGYLKKVCQSDVVQRILDDRAAGFYRFRTEYQQRHPGHQMGNAIPLEFSGAAFRFGHTMVRNVYDFNRNFGRGEGGLDKATFDLMFKFTANGGFFGLKKLPENWVIDWRRFVGVDPIDNSDGLPARNARRIDTEIAPPLGKMVNEGGDHSEGSEIWEMFRHLARRNLRRGYSLRLPTGQALHRHLKQQGQLTSDPIEDVAALFDSKPALQSFLQNNQSGFSHRTPLWFYCLAEAEAAGGESLGELGSWIVASTFIGVMLSDPTSALSTRFRPMDSPLRTENGENGMPIDSIARWMEFALVMEPGQSGNFAQTGTTASEELTA